MSLKRDLGLPIFEIEESKGERKFLMHPRISATRSRRRFHGQSDALNALHSSRRDL